MKKSNAMNKIKIALVQANKIQDSVNDTLLKGLEYCNRSKEMGADIVVFPEMWNVGYMPPFENAWDCPDEKGHEKEIEHWKSLAIDNDSKYINEFCKCAKEFDIAILITYLKKGKGKPFNSSALIDINGNIVQNYSKIHTCDFSMEKHCQSGNGFYVSDLQTQKGIVKTGVMICFDREFPESARTLAIKGAELILVPNSCPIDENRRSQLRSRAFENMTAIAMANYADDNGHSMIFDGIAYTKDGNYRDMKILELDNNEQIGIEEIDLDELQNYRNSEVWGIKYRKPNAYLI